MKIIIDPREQCPFTFQGYSGFAGVETELGTLQSGDYSLAGLVDRVAVERKSLPDLVQCLGRERERFERELQRAQGLDAFAVVIEGTWQELAQGNYRSKLNPHSACQSVAAFMARYRVPFLFVGSRAAAEYVAWSFLRQFLEGARRRFAAIAKAHGQEAIGKVKDTGAASAAYFCEKRNIQKDPLKG